MKDITRPESYIPVQVNSPKEEPLKSLAFTTNTSGLSLDDQEIARMLGRINKLGLEGGTVKRFELIREKCSVLYVYYLEGEARIPESKRKELVKELERLHNLRGLMDTVEREEFLLELIEKYKTIGEEK